LAGVVLLGLLGLVPAAPAEAQARPVLLVGGTFASQARLNQEARPFLEAQGFDVHTIDLATWRNLPLSARLLIGLFGGTGAGTASMVDSGQRVADKVDDILDETGADRIDVIGHSQGAVVARYYVKSLGGLDEVDGLVSLGGANYGIPLVGGDPFTDLAFGIGCGFYQPPVCAEIIHGDVPGDTPFLRALNEPDPTPGDIDYYHLYTESDTPAGGRGEVIELPGATNLSVQSVCPGRQVAHIDEWTDGAMQELITAALHRNPLTSTCP
jgi:triacylglycerol lipase